MKDEGNQTRASGVGTFQPQPLGRPFNVYTDGQPGRPVRKSVQC